jgi:MFS family permease
VTTGFNIGGIIAPPIFGFLMDHGEARLVLLGAAFCALASIPAVMVTIARGRAPQV